jgi:hypothetical protein
MSNEILIHGLKRKYGELAGELRQVHRVSRDIKHSMATIKATLKLFQAEGALIGVKPIAPPVANRWFGRNQCSRAVLDILRTAPEPLTIRQIADQVIVATSIGPIAPRDLRGIADAVKRVLMGRKSIMVATDERPARWALRGSVAATEDSALI